MRARLLLPDLIALPEQFAQLVGLVTDLSASLQAFAEATDRRLDALEGHAAETNRPPHVPGNQPGVPPDERGVPERQRPRKPRPAEHPEHCHERTRA